MRFRKLRIAFSTTCLIACVLLIALWVRSYWWIDAAEIAITKSQLLIVNFIQGGIGFVDQYNRVDPSTSGWMTIDIDTVKANAFIPRKVWDGHHINWGASHMRFSEAYIIMPYWLLVPIAAALVTAPWIRLSKRFTVRTLLIATTLIAVVLGLIVYLAAR